MDEEAFARVLIEDGQYPQFDDGKEGDDQDDKESASRAHRLGVIFKIRAVE